MTGLLKGFRDSLPLWVIFGAWIGFTLFLVYRAWGLDLTGVVAGVSIGISIGGWIVTVIQILTWRTGVD